MIHVIISPGPDRSRMQGLHDTPSDQCIAAANQKYRKFSPAETGLNTLKDKLCF